MKLLIRLIFLFSFIILILNPGCGGGDSGGGGGGGETTKTSAMYTDELVALEGELSDGTITEDQYFLEFIGILDEIDTTSGALAAFETYLETTVHGGGAAAIAVGTGTGLKAETSSSIMDRIEASPVYQFLKNFMTTAIFALVPEPASQALQVAQPETFVSLSTGTVYAILQKAWINGEIDTFTYTDLRNVNSTNPYEAMRQFYAAKGEAVPDWLTPAPTNCLINCEGLNGTYSGAFNSAGNFSRTFPETVCTWSFNFTGTVTLNLASNKYANVYGSSVRVAGSTPWAYVSGDVPARICEKAGTMTFDSTVSVTGYTTSMTWTADMGSGIFPGVFTGSLSGTTVSGNTNVTYTNGTGSVTIPTNLVK